MTSNRVESKDRPTYYRQPIHLASNEWGSDLMLRVAIQWFRRNPKKAPHSLVEVHEHGGWRLSYIHDGTIVETANDRAELCPKAKQFLEETRDGEWIYLRTIKRGVVG